jgi:hypothetical protein
MFLQQRLKNMNGTHVVQMNNNNKKEKPISRNHISAVAVLYVCYIILKQVEYTNR